MNAVLGIVGGILHAQKTSQVTTLTQSLVQTSRDLLALFPLSNIWVNLRFNKFPDLLTESGVGLIEVGRVILHRISILHKTAKPKTTYTMIPSRIGERNQFAIRLLSTTFCGRNVNSRLGRSDLLSRALSGLLRIQRSNL